MGCIIGIGDCWRGRALFYRPTTHIPFRSSSNDPARGWIGGFDRGVGLAGDALLVAGPLLAGCRSRASGSYDTSFDCSQPNHHLRNEFLVPLL